MEDWNKVKNKFQIFKRPTHKHNVWMIMPLDFKYSTFSKKQYKKFSKQNKNDSMDLTKIDSSDTKTNTMVDFKEFTFEIKFIKTDFQNAYNKSQNKFTLVQFSSEEEDFNEEQVLLQISKNNDLQSYFRLNLKNQRNRILLFSDYFEEKNDDLYFFEKKLLVVKASLCFPNMIQAIKSTFYASIRNYMQNFKENNWSDSTNHAACKAVLSNFVGSQMHVFITKSNFQLYLMFLKLAIDLFSKYYKEDARFKAAFDRYRIGVKKTLEKASNEAFDRFYEFEHSCIFKEAEASELIDKVVQIFQSIRSQNKKKALKLMNDNSIVDCAIGPGDLEDIMYFYAKIQRLISEKKSNEFESFENFINNLNSFEGKNKFVNKQD